MLSNRVSCIRLPWRAQGTLSSSLARAASSSVSASSDAFSDLPPNFHEVAERVISRRAEDVARQEDLTQKKRRSESSFKRKRARSHPLQAPGNGLSPRATSKSLGIALPPSSSRSLATIAKHQPASASPSVPYITDKNPLSHEAMAFLAGAEDTPEGADGSMAQFQTLSDAEVRKWRLADFEGGNLTLQRGMVVECRRSGQDFIAVVLSALVGAGKLRYLVLPSSGEILPASTQDVQFVFPPHMVPQEPMLDITDEALGMELGGRVDADEPPLQKSKLSKRTLARALRKVELSVDKRRRELGARGLLEPRAIWSTFLDLKGVDNSEELDMLKHVWTTVTVAEVARHALGIAHTDPVPALDLFVVHKTLMSSPDLFQADEAKMAESQRFSLRPVAQVEALKQVQLWLQSFEAGSSSDGGSGTEMKELVRQSRAIIQRNRKTKQSSLTSTNIVDSEGPLGHGNEVEPLSATSRLIITIIQLRIAERRSTQNSPFATLAPAIIKAIGLYGTHKVDMALMVQALQELGELSEWSSLALIRLKDAAVRDGLPASTWERSNRNDEEVLHPEDKHLALRRDFGDSPVYVIDDARASELDDGISLERTSSPDVNWVHVHIADPTRWISPGDPVARLAERRGATLYVPEGGLAMLELTSLMSRMSLGASSVGGQAVLTFSFKVDSAGTILDRNVQPGLVRNVQKRTYLGASRSLDAPASATQSDLNLITLSHVATALKKARSQHSLEWNYNQLSVSVDIPAPGALEHGSASIPMATVDTPEAGETGQRAQSLVSELMIAANRISGAFCAERALPGLYRGAERPYISPSCLPHGVQADEVLDRLRSMRDPLTGSVDSVEVAKLDMYMGKVPTDISPLDHFQLGVFAKDGGYQRSTSPLRRFSDMVAHWQIKQSLLTGRPLFSAEEMRRKVKALDMREQRVRRAESDAQAYWRSIYLRGLLASGEPFAGKYDLQCVDAVVMARTTYHGVERTSTSKVVLSKIGMAATMETSGRTMSPLRVGERVKVRVVEALTWPAIIRVEPV